jgi:hypothetical protein
VSIACVGLPVVAGVEQPNPGSELGGDVHYLLAVLEESLRERSPSTVAALDRPDPVGPRLGVLAHCGGAGPVGCEPPRPKQLLAIVDDLDGGRQLVGIDPDDDTLHVLLPPVLVAKWTARWALLLRAGQSLLEPRLVTVADGTQTDSEPHPRKGWQPHDELPTGHLDRVWPDVGPRGIV